MDVFLQGFYSDRFGEGVVHIVKDSNPVDRESLDSAKVMWHDSYYKTFHGIYCPLSATSHAHVQLKLY